MLIGSMNPEEGRLRPQLQDRFGLRVVARGLTGAQERLEVYRRVQLYRTNRMPSAPCGPKRRKERRRHRPGARAIA